MQRVTVADILAWLPILRLSRLLALVVIGTALLLAFRSGSGRCRSAATSFESADYRGVQLPMVRGIKGRFSVLGQEFEANAELDTRQNNQLIALQQRIAELEESSDAQATNAGVAASAEREQGGSP